MFYKLYKKIAAVFIVSSVLIMAAVFIFDSLLPDRFYVSNKNPGFSSPYGKFVSFQTFSEKSEKVFSPKISSHSVTAKLLGIFPVKEVSLTFTDEKILTVCGTPFGVKMFTDGVLIVGFSKINCIDGNRCPAVDSGLLEGDILKEINGKKVFTNEEVAEFIENSEGKILDFLIERNGSVVNISVKPEMLKDKSRYKAGFWVRDSSAGIGTITFYDPETLSFGGLGHAVCDVDTGIILPFSSGEIVEAAITKIKKGTAGAPGELGGTFTGNENLGTVKINNETGLYGTLDYKIEGIDMPVAHKQEIYEGNAVILSTINGTDSAEYDIVIEKINLSDNNMTKNMIIKVTDEELIGMTGGIVQGMSGSPIIQDGKLVGAVTHVFVNDPTKGYGIFIENMLEVSKKCK